MEKDIKAAIENFELAIHFLKRGSELTADAAWIAEGDALDGLRALRKVLKKLGGKPTDLSDPKLKMG